MATVEMEIMIRIIKIVLICTLMFHVLLANWKINTMEKRLTDRLDSIDLATSRKSAALRPRQP